MNRSILLNLIESKYYYDTLWFAAQNSRLSYREKLHQSNLAFLSIVNTLTEQREKQIFTGWFAKINFICQAYNLGAEKEEELQSLRRLLKRCTIQTNFEPTEGQFLAALKILTEFVAHFSEEAIPQALAAYFAEVSLPKLTYKERPEKVLDYLYATITQKGEIRYDDQQRGKIELECDTESYGLIRVVVQDIHYHNATNGEVFRKYELSKHCAFLVRPFQSLCLTNLEMVSDQVFASTNQTLLIASPDYLVDATAISNCFISGSSSPYLYLLNKLNFFRGNEFTFSGKLVNDLLDYMVENGAVDYETAFRSIFSQSQLEAAFLELSREKLKEIYLKLKPQFLNIQRVMASFMEPNPESLSPLILTEPSFVSGRFGLQGRIDLLLEYPQNTQRKDIIELKSTSYSNPQFDIARRDHLIQVACYNLLIDSTFTERQGVSAILYSRDEKTPLRDCGKLNFQAQDAMWVRNCIVFIDLKVAEGKSQFYDSFVEKLRHLKLPSYRQEDVNRFVQRWQQASDLDKTYFSEYMGLIAREVLVAKVGGVSGNEPSQGYASLWRNSTAEKQENFALLNHLAIIRIDPARSEIT
ncbi:MAG: hypothetical protein HC880_12965, partial [Bacteroidia bacterium]|nr:hypothetical protein [Bacteroidia bacterium]